MHRPRLLALAALSASSSACTKEAEHIGRPDEAVDLASDEADRLVFRTDVVHRVELALTDSAFVEIQKTSRPEVHAAMTFDREAVGEVGLKLKGTSSYDTLDGKPAFTVDLNEWDDDARYHGLKAFKLNNGTVIDPTRTHEWLAYALARASGLMAPRVGWAQVYCNDEDLGIYMLVEKHDDVMIASYDPAQEDLGVVLDPEDGFVDFGIGGISTDDDTSILAAYEEGPEPPDPALIASLREADLLLGENPTEASAAALWGHVDQAAFLDYLAWETLSTHIDGYTNSRNFRLFVNGSTHVIEWVPSGADNTFHSDGEVFASAGEGGRAFTWCLELPSCRRAYAERVLVMADTVATLDLLGSYEDLTVFLNPYIQADPRSPFTSEDVAQFRADTEERLTSGPATARAGVYAEYPDLVP